ncbi:MAG: hypothetical protein IJ860_00215 [Eubacterium sp.]|nr:hypothetical protein [Eubacterium sp.]
MHSRKFIITLVFVLTLLSFSTANCVQDPDISFAVQEHRASLFTDYISAPILPVSEAEIERFFSAFHNQGSARVVLRTGFGLLFAMFMLALLTGAFLSLSRSVCPDHSDQFYKSTIHYIHCKSDQA